MKREHRRRSLQHARHTPHCSSCRKPADTLPLRRHQGRWLCGYCLDQHLRGVWDG